MTKPTTPPTRRQKPQRNPGRYVLCIGKWAALAMTAEIYGFELKEQPEGRNDGRLRKTKLHTIT